jgi:hypothetical protein
MAYSTADPGQNFAGQTAALFKMQPEFPMTGDLASSSFPSTNPLPTFTIPDDAPAIPVSSFPDHKDVIGGNDLSQQRLTNTGGGSWEFSDMFNFDDLDMDFNFDGPSTSSLVAMDIPVCSSTVSATHDAPYTSVLPTMSAAAAATLVSLNDDIDYRPPRPPPLVPRFPEPRTTSSATPSAAATAANPTVISLNDDVGYHPPCPPPLIPRFPEPHFTSSATPSAAAANPTVISLNDDIGHRPPPPPPLVPRLPEPRPTSTTTSFLKSGSPSALTTDDSDSDSAAAHLFANLNLMKRKTPTPDVSSEDTDPKSWFTTDPSPSSVASTSKSSHKHLWLSVAARTDASDVSASIAATVHALQEQKTLERHADHNQKAVVHETQLTDKKQQHEHEWSMQQKRQEHEMLMAMHQKNLADSELRKMELQLEIIKFQARSKAQSVSEPESGEGDES